MNEHQNILYLNCRKTSIVYTIFFKFKSTSTEVNLLPCLIRLSDKIAYSSLDWSDYMSIKLFAKGHLPPSSMIKPYVPATSNIRAFAIYVNL